MDTFVGSDGRRVKIRDMGRYYDVLFAIERTTLFYWSSYPQIDDRYVNNELPSLLIDPDNHEEGTLAYGVSKGVKAMLMLRRRRGIGGPTMGEVLSCIEHVVQIARVHESPDGKGYLKWIRTFFEGKNAYNLRGDDGVHKARGDVRRGCGGGFVFVDCPDAPPYRK